MYRDCKMNIDPKKKKVVLELLSFCNLNCRHCLYRGSSGFHSLNFLSKDKIFKLIDKFTENNINKLVLTGGEPTLHPFFIEISKYAISKIPRVSLCTNGVILNKELKRRIIELSFSTYTTSIDSHIDIVHNKFRGKEGALTHTIDFLQELKLKNKKISIHITIHPDNIDHIEETIRFCRKFAPEIVVSSIYHSKLKMDSTTTAKYNKEIKRFKEKYIDSPDIILVGFSPFCKNKNCLDLKNIFMINQKAELIKCYWKKNGGKIVKTFSQLLQMKKI